MEIIDIDEKSKDDLGDVIILIKEYIDEELEDMTSEYNYLEVDIKNRENFNRATYSTELNRQRLSQQIEGFKKLSDRIENIFKANKIEFEKEDVDY